MTLKKKINILVKFMKKLKNLTFNILGDKKQTPTLYYIIYDSISIHLSMCMRDNQHQSTVKNGEMNSVGLHAVLLNFPGASKWADITKKEAMVVSYVSLMPFTFLIYHVTYV